MKTRRTASELARGLERHHLKFRSFTLTSEGAWSAEDADWNYKDIPHLNVVHTQARQVSTAIDEELIATINMQRIARIWSPISLFNYVASDGSQVYYTTMLWFVLIVETRITDLSHEVEGSAVRARADTTYHVGGPRWAMALFPLLRRVLTANYRVLMSEDLPMRERRGQLRAAGYRFASDGHPRGFAETEDLTVVNVIPPASDALDEPAVVDLEALASEGATVTVGPGPGGLRFVSGQAREVLIFDRVCSHEGANLDCAVPGKGVLVCPWHAKRVKPLATVNLDDLPADPIVAARYELMIEGNKCIVSSPPPSS